MRKFAFLWTICMILAFQMGPLTDAQADAVGRLTLVEGRVDILRGGQLPATPVKVDDGVQTGDVLRTKSLSKAQITFIDNSTLTISPESRVGIEAYMFDSAQNKRNAVVQLFQGLAHVVVSKVFKSAEPDFVVKTHTAIMGVRGTEFGIRLHPNSSDILNFEGCPPGGQYLSGGEPTVPEGLQGGLLLWLRGRGRQQWVFLKAMQGTTVGQGLPPTLPYTLANQDRDMFIRQLTALVPKSGSLNSDSAGGASTSTGGQASTIPGSVNPPGAQTTLTTLNTVTVPPPVLPTVVEPQALTPAQSPVTPSYQTYDFTQVFAGTYTKPSDPPYAVALYNSSSPGSGTRTGVYASAFTANFSLTATAPSGTFSPSSSGSFTANSTASVTGPAGGILTGTMKMGASTGGGTTFTLSGPVTLNPNGNLTYQTNGTFMVGTTTGTITGTWTQTNSPTTPAPAAAALTPAVLSTVPVATVAAPAVLSAKPAATSASTAAR